MSIMRIGTKRVPFSGGGYLRLLPLWLINRGFAQQHKMGRPAVIYLHPRDFAPDCPRVPMPLHRRFKCYVNTRGTKNKLKSLLNRYQFDSCAHVLGVNQDS